jgi:hypothetical protein
VNFLLMRQTSCRIFRINKNIAIISEFTVLSSIYLYLTVPICHIRGKEITMKTRGSVGWACVAHLLFCFEKTLYRTFNRCFLPNFGTFGYSVSDEKIFLEIDQSETRTACSSHVCYRNRTKWAFLIEDLP